MSGIVSVPFNILTNFTWERYRLSKILNLNVELSNLSNLSSVIYYHESRLISKLCRHRLSEILCQRLNIRAIYVTCLRPAGNLPPLVWCSLCGLMLRDRQFKSPAGKPKLRLLCGYCTICHCKFQSDIQYLHEKWRQNYLCVF